jgi:hypothetical protein
MKSKNNFLQELFGALILALGVGLPFALYFLSMKA